MLTLLLFKHSFQLILRKTKSMVQQTPTGSSERQTRDESCRQTYAGIAEGAANAEDKEIADQQRKREPVMAVMGWQSLLASCNRAISKKLRVVDAPAFQSCC
jgi:hypothetical protein